MGLKVGSANASADAKRGRLSRHDVASYGLAWLAWLALIAASAFALQAVRSVVGPLTLALLLKNIEYPRQAFNIGGQAFVADRIALVVLGLLWIVYAFLTEDYLRSSVATARGLRLRAGRAEASAPDFAHGWLRRHGLVELARRTAIAAALPAGAALLYGLLQGWLWLITR